MSTARLRWWAGVLAVAAVLLGLAWMQQAPPNPLPDAPVAPAARKLPALQTSGETTPSRDAAAPEVLKSVALADPLAASPDLLQVFQHYRDSGDPRLKAAAQRAFSACTPAFLPRPGETPSPEPLIAALPAAQRMAREEALRSLYARCQSFMGLGRDALLKLRGELAADGGLREAGQQLEDELAAGNIEQASRWATGALRSGDPAAIASIAAPLERLLEKLSLTHAGSDAAANRIAAQDLAAALPLLACDLGMDCSSRSLAALHLCAAQGQCEGDVEARFLASAAIDPGRTPAVQAQRRRLLALYRQGRPPAADELLP